MELKRQIEKQQEVVDKAANEFNELKKRLEIASNNYKRKYPDPEP
jgi:hypothetical protein